MQLAEKLVNAVLEAAYDSGNGFMWEADRILSVCRRCHEDITGHIVKLRWTDDSNRQKTLRIERVA